MCSRSWCRDRDEMEGLGGRNSWGSIVGLPLCLLGTWSESLASWEVTRASERGQFLPAIAAPNKGKRRTCLRKVAHNFLGHGRTSHIHISRPHRSTTIPKPLDQVEFLQLLVR